MPSASPFQLQAHYLEIFPTAEKKISIVNKTSFYGNLTFTLFNTKFQLYYLEMLKILNTVAAKLLFLLYTTLNELNVSSFFIRLFHKSSEKETGNSFILF